MTKGLKSEMTNKYKIIQCVIVVSGNHCATMDTYMVMDPCEKNMFIYSAKVFFSFFVI